MWKALMTAGMAAVLVAVMGSTGTLLLAPCKVDTVTVKINNLDSAAMDWGEVTQIRARQVNRFGTVCRNKLLKRWIVTDTNVVAPILTQHTNADVLAKDSGTAFVIAESQTLRRDTAKVVVVTGRPDTVGVPVPDTTFIAFSDDSAFVNTAGLKDTVTLSAWDDAGHTLPLSGVAISLSNTNVAAATITPSASATTPQTIIVSGTGSTGVARIIASAKYNQKDTLIIVNGAPPAAANVYVAFNPSSRTVGAGSTVSDTAKTYSDAALTVGTTGKALTINSLTPSIATASPSSGSSPLTITVTGVAGGAGQIVVTTVTGHKDTLPVTVTAPVTPPTGHFVAVGGAGSGPGTIDNPWSLSYAFNGAGGQIAAGDTIYVRGGIYSIGEITYWTSAGTSGSKVTFRNMPSTDLRGERVRWDGNINVYGDNTNFWGMELYRSSPPTTGNALGFNIRAPGTGIIHMLVHDHGQSGIGDWIENVGGQTYGNYVYNNGTHQNLDHGIYFQDSSSTVTKRFRDNIVFDNLTYGFHGYISGSNKLINTDLVGNCVFNNGKISSSYTERADFLIGAASGSPIITNIRIDSNATFRNSVAEETADIGWHSGQAGGALVLQGNRFVGTRFMNTWASVDSTPANIQHTSFPGSGSVVFLRKSDFDTKRANLCIYNWDNVAQNVSVDLSTVLTVGQNYAVYHVFDYWGTAVTSGTYAGGSVNIPLSNTKTPPATLGRSYPSAPNPGPRFGAFVVLGQ